MRVHTDKPGRTGTGAAAPPFLGTPWLCRLAITGWTVLAAVLALRSGLPSGEEVRPLLGVLATLLGLVVLDLEIGRAVEGGRLVGQRPHKGLSAWPFAAVLMAPTAVAVLVVVPVYALCRWRGMRVQLWKWVGSGAIGIVAGSAADLTHSAYDSPSTAGLLAAGAVFLVASAAGFWVPALTGDPVDEGWLRAQLRSPAYYGNEAAVLCQGAVIALLYAQSPALVLLVVPSFAVLQRALLHAPLRDRADRDTKTGLLNHGAWTTAAEHELALPRPVALLLVDLDHFKGVNDAHGHLVGDLALSAVARALEATVRPADLVGRFGGEEFCVLLPDVHLPEGLAVAERVRRAVSDVRVVGQPSLRLSASVGVSAVRVPRPDGLSELLTSADRALLRAKGAGRDRVVGPATLPAQRCAEPFGRVPTAPEVSDPVP